MRRLFFTTSGVLIAAFLLGPSAYGQDVTVSGQAKATRSLAELEKEFAEPPDSARPWVFWFFKNGNIDRRALTADLEAMRRAGIGGVIIMEVSLGVPKGKIDFFSPEWRDVFKHIVTEARRLSIMISMNTAPGWTGSGGAWVTPEQSMQKITYSEVAVEGPRPFSEELPQPPTVQGFYRDVSVLAFPTPRGDYRINDIVEKAFYDRGPISSQPESVRPAFVPRKGYPRLPEDEVIAADKIVDLADKMDVAGRLTWDAPEGRWTIMRFGHTSTGQTNRPAPSPGLECDKLSRTALDAHFRDFVEKLVADAGDDASGTFVSTHLDSWEVGAQNWTSGFEKEFRRRRGYDPMRYLPVMTGRVVGSLEVSERFLWDLRQTVSEMIVEYHGRRLAELARRHGMWLSIEPYDMTPCDDMTLGATADVPMCEFWCTTFDTWYSVKEASSVAHVYGKPIVDAEAFTSGGSDRWTLHPGAVKHIGDRAYCEGVNRFVIHRYVHQPYAQARPGLSLGPHGLHYERTQTWWEMSRPWHEYLARCQFVLQGGRFVADALYLNQEGAPSVFKPPRPAPQGYKYDACTAEALLQLVRVRDGELVLPSGMRYRVLVLSESSAMTPALLAKVKRLVEEGAAVVGNRPSKSPSLAGYPQCDQEVRRLADALWGEGPTPSEIGRRPLGRGRVVFGHELSPRRREELAAAESVEKGMTPSSERATAMSKNNFYPESDKVEAILRGMGAAPDFEADAPLRFIHRRFDDGDVYFVCNAKPQTVRASATFRSSGRRLEIWHPETGERRALRQFSRMADGRTVVPLRFEATESYFVVFRDRSADDLAVDRPAGGGNFEELATVTAVDGPWTVTFDAKLGGPREPVEFDALADWRKRPEESIRFYSGPAVYTKTFDVSADLVDKGRPLLLDLGGVAIMAQVTLNNRDLGIVWKEPFRVEISGAVRPGANRLKVEVVNLWPNRMIGDENLPADCETDGGGGIKSWPQWLLDGKPSPTGRYTFSTWRPFGKGSRLLRSGLLGPVTLKTVARQDGKAER